MFFLKLIAKLILLPILFLVLILRLVVNIITKVYSIVVVWFWIALVGVIIMIIGQHSWNVAIIFGILGIISFLLMVFSVWMTLVFEDLSKAIGRYLIS